MLEIIIESDVVMVLPDPFRGIVAWRNSTETQQSGHAPRSEPEVKSLLHKSLAASTWWCGLRPPYERWPKWRDNISESLTIRSFPIVWRTVSLLYGICLENFNDLKSSFTGCFHHKSCMADVVTIIFETFTVYVALPFALISRDKYATKLSFSVRKTSPVVQP